MLWYGENAIWCGECYGVEEVLWCGGGCCGVEEGAMVWRRVLLYGGGCCGVEEGAVVWRRVLWCGGGCYGVEEGAVAWGRVLRCVYPATYYIMNETAVIGHA